MTKHLKTKHLEETIKKLEAAIKEAQFQIDELNKPKTHYPQLTKGFTVLGEASITSHVGNSEDRYLAGNIFETKEKAERSNLHKLLNSEYDYWFPGFSEKPDFEPNGLEYWDYDFQDWSLTYVTTKDFKGSIYRWKRSEN